jgi:hypothetical protein
MDKGILTIKGERKEECDEATMHAGGSFWNGGDESSRGCPRRS